MIAFAIRCFNPRTRDGCEGSGLIYPVDEDVSIHAPVMGANLTGQIFDSNKLVSIHAPVMGANKQIIKNVCLAVFQSTHP